MRAWIKDALDQVIQLYLGEADLEFAWAGDDVVDPLQQAQTLQILVAAGIKTKDEARADLGLAPLGEKGDGAAGLGKFNPYHDRRGLFTDAAGAVTTSLVAADAVSNRTPDKYSVNLADEDSKYGGHVIKEHVGRSEQDLTQTIIDSASSNGVEIIGRWRQGSFVSVESANDFVNQVLQRNKDVVDSVASGGADSAWLEERFGYPTGVEAVLTTALTSYARKTYNVGVWIVHDERSPRGYRVDTAYPCNDKRNYPVSPPD
jgi:hypothetical protein